MSRYSDVEDATLTSIRNTKSLTQNRTSKSQYATYAPVKMN